MSKIDYDYLIVNNILDSSDEDSIKEEKIRQFLLNKKLKQNSIEFLKSLPDDNFFHA